MQNRAILIAVLAGLPLQVATAADSTSHDSRTPRPADEFIAALSRLCGQSYAGRVTANEPAVPEDPFDGKALVMHVRECDPARLRVPFHVGEDRSRTWVLRRTDGGLQLKHDHRHPDGSEDAVTMYGGHTTAPGTATRQEFPADAESRALFERAGLAASLGNVWAMEIEPGKRFVYELARPGRLFRVEFDLSQPVQNPPPTWGSETGH